MNSKYIKIILALLFFCSANISMAQDKVLNKYGLKVIKAIGTYKASIKSNPANELINLEKLIPNLVMDLRYATVNNFTKQQLYPAIITTWLRKKAALSLFEVQKKLNKQGLGLKIFDAYRPYAATEKMWALVKDERYAADPKKGSGHNRGIAVDLTIINLKTGNELNMGTGFDNFTDSAHHDFMALPKDVLQNRLLLKKTMEDNGFKALETEWWHYALPNGNAYELLDLNFDQLN